MKSLLRIFLFFVFIHTMPEQASAQDEKLNANIAIAANYSGFYNNTFSFGIGFQPWDVRGDYVSYPLFGFTATYDYVINRSLYGLSFNGYYLSGPIAFGLGANRFTELENITYGIKPMIGISIARIHIMFGYNFFLNKNQIDRYYHPSFNIGYYLPVFQRKDE
ncbi:MAG TPA: hypothetical protein VK177_03950 [Flavobacteriales bacterium]|nr:hypothetical protein [Flavobacteriales bacterium]